MARRGRVKVQFIEDRAERERTLKKRLPVLLKKTSEFAVLCDVPTSLIMYLPGQDQPVVWPSPDGVADVLRRYNQVGDSERLNHKLDGTKFIGKLMEKAKAELSTVQRQNNDKEINLLIMDFVARRRQNLDDLSPDVFAALEWNLEKKRQAVKARLEELSAGAFVSPLPTHVELPPFVQAPGDMPMLHPHEGMVQPQPLMMPPQLDDTV